MKRNEGSYQGDLSAGIAWKSWMEGCTGSSGDGEVLQLPSCYSGMCFLRMLLAGLRNTADGLKDGASTGPECLILPWLQDSGPPRQHILGILHFCSPWPEMGQGSCNC